MKRGLPFCVLLAALGSVALGVEVEMSGETVEIPSPEGFVAVDSSMAELERYLKTLVAATNSYLAAYVAP